MIYYWLHIVYVFLGSRLFWSKLPVDAVLTRKRRVSIFDCEAFRLMANSKYFYYMDLIRFELLFRSPLYGQTVGKRIFPVLASQKIIYKSPLKIWSRFEITLHLEGWDEKWAYHRQVFTQEGKICAVGFTKVGFWKDKKIQSMTSIIAKCGASQAPRAPNDSIQNIYFNDHSFLDGAI